MPMIVYGCESNHLEKKFVRNAKDAASSLTCPKCSKEMKRLLRGPSFETKIVIDNGFQAKQVEVNPNIVEMNDQNALKDHSQE